MCAWGIDGNVATVLLCMSDRYEWFCPLNFWKLKSDDQNTKCVIYSLICGKVKYIHYFCYKLIGGQNQFPENLPQVVGQLDEILFSIPWGHHRYLMDKYSKDPAKAFYYVRKTMEEGWSRDVMLNHMDSNLYERDGKALTNFKNTLPEVTIELAQELTKDPYHFAFTGITQPYNERILKDALLNNFLTSTNHFYHNHQPKMSIIPNSLCSLSVTNPKCQLYQCSQERKKHSRKFRKCLIFK